jgi:hypothetical protein
MRNLALKSLDEYRATASNIGQFGYVLLGAFVPQWQRPNPAGCAPGSGANLQQALILSKEREAWQS